jgi:aminopeptidase N
MGINEQRYPFMDEGWTTAFEYLINIRDNDQAWATSIFQNFRSIGNLLPTVDTELPIITPLDSMRHAGVAFGYNPYGKPALAYLSLKELMGDQAFKASLQEFIARWHGKHPTPWDMFNTFNDTYDQDLTWFFNSWFFEPNYIDLAVEDVQPTDGGYTIEVRNAGGFAVPFDLQVLYADDTTAIFRQNPAIWQDAPTLAAVTIDSDQAVKAIALDVGIFLDAAPQDNVWQSQ